MKKQLLFYWAFLILNVAFSQQKTENLLLKLLQQQPDKFSKILANPTDYRVQILYTQIERDKNNVPTFKSYSYRFSHDEYFYPASTVKFPACLLALEKLNGLGIMGLDKDSPMLTDSIAAISNYPPQYIDLSKTDSTPTIAHYIKKILLVSDNDAFNRLYEFIGQELFNKNLYVKGYKNLRIVHRLSIPLSRFANKLSNPMSFYLPNSKLELLNTNAPDNSPSYLSINPNNMVFSQPALVSAANFESMTPIKLGKGYMSNGALVNEPFDFTYKNYFALDDQQAMLKAVLFPEVVNPNLRFNLTEGDYKFLYKYMSMSPLESNSPLYNKDTTYYDSYCKFFMFGDNKKPMPKNIRIFNKVGDAYGFLIDNAYVVDFEKGVEFLLSAVIYCNSDGIFNDDKYDYDTVGFPFFSHLGKAIYDYEVKRPKKFKPDLSKFKIDYND
jgi:hypothetical protein